MSNSDSDSEGFKSADDNEFEDSEKLTEDKPKNGAKKNSDDKANVKNVSKSEEKPVREEKLKEDKKPKSAGSKLIEVRNDNKPSKSSETKLEDDNSNDNDFDDNWEWGDDEDANAINEQASDDKANEPEKHSELNVEIASNKEANEKQSPRVNTKFNNSLNNSQEPTTSWAPWSGVVSFLSTASDGVASFTSHVSSVIESNIGIPDPGEIAQRQRLLKKELSTEKPATESSVDETNNDGEQRQSQEREENSLSLGSFVSNVTQLSNRVISGGLDTLEGIGKKTMNILQENDPGLLNKRKLLGLDNTNPVLSQILREAKEKSEEAEKNMKLAQKKTYKKTLHFETLFDDYHGLVHLEALEMLSKQATIRLQSLLMPLTGKALTELNDTLNEVKELCELNELEQEDSPDGAYESTELQDKLFTSIEDLDIPVDFSDILETWTADTKWLKENIDSEDEIVPQNVHDRALQCLAKTSALAVNKYHKLAELLLIKEHHNTANEADALVQVTNTLCWHLSGIATRFGGHLSNVFANSSEVDTNSLITSIFLEGSKSASYIQNAFQLFIPILQMGAV